MFPRKDLPHGDKVQCYGCGQARPLEHYSHGNLNGALVMGDKFFCSTTCFLFTNQKGYEEQDNTPTEVG